MTFVINIFQPVCVHILFYNPEFCILWGFKVAIESLIATLELVVVNITINRGYFLSGSY